MSFKSKKQITAGIHASMEAMMDGREFERIFIKKGHKSPQMEEVIKIAKSKGIPFSFVPSEKLDRLTNVSHQGVVGILSIIEYQALEDIVPFIFEQGKIPLVLLLDRLTDVRNFGAICRTAECMGVDCIIIPERGAAQINTEALRSSAGAISRIPICRTHELIEAVHYLQQSGIQVFAASEKASVELSEAKLDGPVALVMGSEEDGVSKELLTEVDATLRIPLLGKTSSLNVSVAAGMMLYEVNMQRAHIETST